MIQTAKPFHHVSLFLDGADKSSMLEWAKSAWVSGFTTNPSLMRKAGVQDYKAFALEILKAIPDKPISFEVFADEIPEMKTQALQIKGWGPNVFVKIPIVNTRGESTVSLIRELSQQGVRLNVTAILTFDQVKSCCEALKGGAEGLVSVFAGRIADTGRDPLPLMLAAKELCRWAGPKTKLLWASCREFYNISQADQMECDIITVPPDVLKKASGWNRDLFDLSLDTVRTFKKDSDASGFKI
jgi:transaldolase